jgi:hypothetical protein
MTLVHESVGSGQFAPATTVVVRDVAGKVPTTIEQFARDYAEAFRA